MVNRVYSQVSKKEALCNPIYMAFFHKRVELTNQVKHTLTSLAKCHKTKRIVSPDEIYLSLSNGA